MTFEEWFTELFHDSNRDPAIEAEIKTIASLAWNQALVYSIGIIQSMDGCTDVQYCKRDGLEAIAKLRL